MKSRKTRTLVALWLAAIGGFSLMFANADDSNNFKEIKMDITNAVQTIPQIIFKKTVSDSDEVILTNVGRLIKIDTKGKGFVLSRRWSSAAGSNSTVLGWEYNNIGGSNSNNSTIIWWSNNSINSSSNAVIWWWDYNSMSNSNYWTIAWWYKNSSNAEHATVVWGSNNNAGGEYSVVLWKEAKANGKYSVSLWQYATVTKDSSFLWNDGTSNQTLDRANIFAVIGKSGMVVNMDKAHRFAQLTLWWSLFINQSASDLTWASSCARWTKWVVRVIPGPTDQVCFCSCDGESWNSLFGPWECNKKCGSLADPECDVSKLKKICTSEERYTYTGWCKQWDVVDGDGAYLVDREGNVHWSCQTNDGATKGCVAQIERSNIEWSCEKDVGEYKCNGVLSGYVVVSESDKGLAYNDDNNAKLYSTLSEAQSAVSAGVKCAYVCDEWLYKAWDECIRGKSCPRKTLTKDGARYTVPKMDHNSTTGVSYKNSAMECSGTVTCFDGEMTLEHTCRAYASCEEQDFGWYHVLATNNGQTRNVYKSSTTTHGSYICERQVDCNDSKLSRTPGVSEKCDYKCDSGYVLDGYEVNHSLWNGVIYDVAKTISSASWDTYCNNRVQCSLWVLKLIWPRPEDKPECKLNPNWCSGTTIDWFKIDAMSHGESAQYYKSIEWLDGGCTTVAKCSYGKTTIWPVTCDFRCKGSEPELAIMWANKFTDKNYSPTAWTYVSNKTNPWACEWKCDQDWWYKVNSAETACVKEGYCEVMIRQGANMSWQYTTDNFKVSSLIWDSSFWCAYDDDGAVYSLESTCPEEVQRLNTTVGWIVMKAWYEFVKWTDLAGNTLSTNLNSINLNCGWSAYLRWKCADGYEYGWWKCRKSYACGQPKPTWNGILFWADKYLEWYTPSTWTYTNTSGALNACQYTCDTVNGYVWNPTSKQCELWTYDCWLPKPTWSEYVFWPAIYTYGYTPSTWTYTSGATLNACQYTCKTHYIWNPIAEKCDPETQDVSCGDAPKWSTWVIWTYKQTWNGNWWTPGKPDNNCVTDNSSTKECSFICDSDSGRKCNEAGTGCERKYELSLCVSTHYNCTNDWTASNTGAVEWSDRYTWDCPDETWCYEECPTGQTLHNGNCVKNEPKTITITCNATVDTRQSSNLCTSSTWTDTTYTASDNLPFTVYIAQNLYEKWIASRNGCDATYHQGVTYVANHIINAGNRVSTWRWAKFNSSVSWNNELWYDGKVSYGVSTISKSSDLLDDFAEITSPVTTITDTVNGQEYVINLVDCAGWGISPSPVLISPKCWIASGQSYPSPWPIEEDLCLFWDPSKVSHRLNKRQRSCATDTETVFCSANAVLDPDPDPDPQPGNTKYCFWMRYNVVCSEVWAWVNGWAGCDGPIQWNKYVTVNYYPSCSEGDWKFNIQPADWMWQKKVAAKRMFPPTIESSDICNSTDFSQIENTSYKCYFRTLSNGGQSHIYETETCSKYVLVDSLDTYSGWYKCAD